MSKTEEKLKKVITGTSGAKRTTFTPAQRAIYLRLQLGFEASGFVGASASIAFPRIELAPTDKNNPKAGVAIATLEGKAFAGAKAEAELKKKVSWASTAAATNEDWKSMISISGGVGGSVGVSAEASMHFGYKDGHIRFACAAEATFVVGGKGMYDFDIGLVQGLEFLAQLARCVDYHYIAAIAEDLYETLGAYKYAMLIAPQTSVLLGGLYVLKDIDERVDTAKKFVNESKELYQKVTNFVDKSVQNGIFKVDKKDLIIIRSQVNRVKTSPPEAIARFLLVVMKDRQELDCVYIEETLNAIESDHEMRWAIRFLGLFTQLYELKQAQPSSPTIVFKETTFTVSGGSVIATNKQLRTVMDSMAASGKGKEKDVMLEKGVKALLDFGFYYDDDEGKQIRSYNDSLIGLFKKNGIQYVV